MKVTREGGSRLRAEYGEKGEEGRKGEGRECEAEYREWGFGTSPSYRLYGGAICLCGLYLGI